MKKLAHLKLGIDLESAANDTLTFSHNHSWYLRSFKRRWQLAKDIAAACVKIESITFEQLVIDDEGNSMEHSFVVSKDGEGKTIKPVKQWWMDRQRVSRRAPPLEGIPDEKEMVSEEDYNNWRYPPDADP